MKLTEDSFAGKAYQHMLDTAKAEQLTMEEFADALCDLVIRVSVDLKRNANVSSFTGDIADFKVAVVIEGEETDNTPLNNK